MPAQRRIGLGFGPRTSTADVLRGVDLSDKLAIVTGGYSGLGLETTRALVSAGARVVVPARRRSEAEAALAGLQAVEVERLDLGDLDSVLAFAERFVASRRTVDIVVNNAGIMACPELRLGPGWEAQFAINHLGHYALVNGLWPAVSRSGGRVVAVSSAGHHFSDVRWDDIHMRTGYDKWKAYGQAKTACALFAVHLDRLARRHGVRAYAVHPGSILTPLQRHLARDEMRSLGWIDENGRALDRSLKTAEQGAATQVWAATSAQLRDIGGVYCEDSDIADVATGDKVSLRGVREYAIDPDNAARLWALSAQLTGIDAFTPHGIASSARRR